MRRGRKGEREGGEKWGAEEEGTGKSKSEGVPQFLS